MAGFDLAAVLGQAASMDTGINNGREKIEYIPYQQILPDAGNFYSLEGIDELATNIELVGLQQPVRVKKIPGTERLRQMYRIVSGHRRLAAWRKLDMACPEETYREIPAIVEPDRDEPAELQELRLIFANSDTRKMTGHDLQQQAQRIRGLLQKLKDNGYEFKGRMRDQVAQICGVSKSKLSRLDAIRNNLHAGIYNAYYQTTEISETAAYEISKLPMKEQSEICRKLSKGWRPTTEKILQYISDRAEAKKDAERDAAADLKAIQDTIRREYDHLTSQADEPDEDLPETAEDVPNMGTKEDQPYNPITDRPVWQTGTPSRDGLYYCRILIEGTKIDQVLVYREHGGMTGGPEWMMKHGYAVHGSCEILGWWPLPEEDL